MESLIKNNNEVVAYHIEDHSIVLHFYDYMEGMSIEFYKEMKRGKSKPGN